MGLLGSAIVILSASQVAPRMVDLGESIPPFAATVVDGIRCGLRGMRLPSSAANVAGSLMKLEE